MKPRIKKFYRMIEDRGWKGRVIPIGHLSDLREAILGYYKQGLIDKELFRDQLDFLSFDPPADLQDSRSIIIVGVPTKNIMPDEIYLPQFKFYVSGFSTSPFGIEWMRFQID